VTGVIGRWSPRRILFQTEFRTFGNRVKKEFVTTYAPPFTVTLIVASIATLAFARGNLNPRDNDDVAFIQKTATGIDRNWSLKREHPAARTLMRQVPLDVDESNRALESMYVTEVNFASFKDAHGKILAEGTRVGTAHTYGHAHSPENINDVLSDALKDSYANVLTDAELQAWFSGTSSGSTTAHTAESAEERPEAG